jgi:deazaflavin-dependent oxidoreductase (nitroreductase family)
MSAFPDVRWGRENSRLRWPLIWFSCTRTGSWLIRSLTPLDRRLLLRSNGRYTVLGPMALPVLLLTTTGASSGLARTTPLLFARDDDTLIVVGSNFGQPHHPAWTRNLLADPAATVAIGGTSVPVTAQLLTGGEADRAFERMVAIGRTYDEYRNRTDREIRVFRLRATSPASETSG